MYRLRILNVTALLLLFTVLPVRAAELVMFVQAGCPWCALWREQIGPVYPKTEEGKRAPLRVVDIDEPIPPDLDTIKVERFTPTFVLVENGKEFGRIRGYPGDEFFWYLLNEALEDLDEK